VQLEIVYSHACLLRKDLGEVNLVSCELMFSHSKKGKYTDDFSPDRARHAQVRNQSMSAIKLPKRNPFLLLKIANDQRALVLLEIFVNRMLNCFGRCAPLRFVHVAAGDQLDFPGYSVYKSDVSRSGGENYLVDPFQKNL
jgi:hypothetical protein